MPTKPGLLQASAVLFILTLASNLCNYGFHALASRVLGPADYGALVSMLALLTIMVIPSQTIQLVVTRQVSLLEVANEHGRVRVMAWQVLRRVVILGGALWLGLVLAGPVLKSFLQLPSAAPVAAVGAATMVCLLLPVSRGVLQGYQRFGQLGLNTFIDGVLRLLFGALFIYLGWRVTGGVLAGAFSGLAAFLLASRFLLPQVAAAGKAEPLEFSAMYRAAMPVVMSLGAYLALSSLDILMVKHYFEPVEAGYYSAASLVGKAFLFLSYAIAQVLYPKASVDHVQEKSTHALLLKSLGLLGVVILVSIAAVWWLAPLVIFTLFGKEFMNPTTLKLVQLFGMAISPLALVYVLTQYNLAIANMRMSWLLLLDIPVFALLLAFFHASLHQVLGIMAINHGLVFVAGYCLTPARSA